VSQIAAWHHLSVRQVERIFEAHVGLRPKVFARIERLQRALRMSHGDFKQDWAALALSAGYFDQSHMVREFRVLTGETPLRFKALQQRGRGLLAGDHKPDVAFVLSPAGANRLP
jgi:AraC-like DNA-binding protein